MHLRKLIPAAVLCFASIAAHADTFSFSASGSAGGFSGTGTLDASSNGNGSYTINGITGPGVNSLLGVGTFSNDNLLFPAGSSLLDSSGFAFKDTQGDTTFMIRIYDQNGQYYAFLHDNDGLSQTLPVDFSLAATTPEPSSLLLLATGLLGAGAMMRRRFTAPAV